MWKRGGTAIRGASSTTYQVGQDDVGTIITAEISFDDDLGASETITLTAASDVDNVNDSPSGLSLASTGDLTDPDEGDVFSITGTLSDDDGTSSASLAYTWKRDGSAISGATSSTYTLVDADVGTTLSVDIVFDDDQGTTETITLTAADSSDNVNDAPAFTSRATTSATGDTAYSYSIPTSD